MINIENKSHPQLGESFSTQEEFFETIWQYGLSQGFTIRYGKVDNRNKEKEICKRTILCSCEGTSVAKKDDDKPKRKENQNDVVANIWYTQFLKIVNMKASQVLLTDDDKEISNAYNNTFYYYNTKHQECDQITFNELWNSLKNDYPKAVAYLVQMEKTVDKWAACYNHNVFMADMTTTQQGESMNHLIKGYMDATTLLSAFIQAFKTALDSHKECIELEIYQQDNNNIIFQTTSPYEKQAAHFLT
ncbi:7472_t:CDS:2 [Cetraspora pellucida]|uniref:7472_t:CDS:1 n=1 Tax=Cetraspora pellucida TaxID=1433469 RepID=A0A9N9P4P7_9GLOM|nr:7472_t:CDS:2 [Cetraspora pellucida]